MSEFWRMVVGPTPGERVNAALTPMKPASDGAMKIAQAIEKSVGQWAFEDDQGHAHSYGLGITVSLGGSRVWQGARDEHVRSQENILLEAPASSADAIVIATALKKRREQHKQEQLEAAKRQQEAREVARAKRANEAIEKLARGERLDDPHAVRFPNPYSDVDYVRALRRY